MAPKRRRRRFSDDNDDDDDDRYDTNKDDHSNGAFGVATDDDK